MGESGGEQGIGLHLAPAESTHGETHALVVSHRGKIVAEHYGSGYSTPCGVDTTYISWSMAKSITHALIGILVGDGLLDVHRPAPVAQWAGTPRENITVQNLLEMRSGLRWVEDYVDGNSSHVIDMLFGAGIADHASYAAALPLDHAPGEVWNYSSGTTNIICGIIGDVVSRGTANTPLSRRRVTERFIQERLFTPLGMSSAVAKFDVAGNFVGSSYVYATALDFVKFGELYMNDGWVTNASGVRERIIPDGWMPHGRRVTANDPDTATCYGSHWWSWPVVENSLVATGYEGQYTVVVPEEGLVVTRLGKTDAKLRPAVMEQLQSVVSHFTNL